MFYIEPVINTYIDRVLEQTDRGLLNDEGVAVLTKMKGISQRECPDAHEVQRRAIRALEISFCFTMGVQQYKTRDWKPDPRFDISNLHMYEAILQEVQEKGIIYFVEAALQSDPLTDGVKPITKTKVKRAGELAEVTINGIRKLRSLLLQDDLTEYSTFGNLLAFSTQVMAVGLTTQIILANELRNP